MYSNPGYVHDNNKAYRRSNSGNAYHSPAKRSSDPRDVDMDPDLYAMPKSFANRGHRDQPQHGGGRREHSRQASKTSLEQMRMTRPTSDESEGRRLGRPVTMPPLPKVDYHIPRASVISSMGPPGGSHNPSPKRSPTTEVIKPLHQAPIQKSPRKAIRTPSGRHISASDYLKGGYTPQQRALKEGWLIKQNKAKKPINNYSFSF